MAFVPIGLPDADVQVDPGWLPTVDADALFTTLRGGIPWEVHRIRLFGRLVDSPRLSCWIGDPGTAYAYSGTRFEPKPWPAALLPVRERLSRETGVDFNSMLANYYRDGSDYMGWHSDNERALGQRPVIASLSLGHARRFVFRQRSGSRDKHDLMLSNGALLLMAGDTQALYQHALPATTKPVGARINLTFRRIEN
jgi:alkylated DNA repair dioxygenase AlkB